MHGAWWFGALLIGVGCSAAKDEEPEWKKNPVVCEDDSKCAKGFVCTDKICQPGERSAAELEARRKSEAAATADEATAPKAPEAGHGRLRVRICPGFKRTIESIGTLAAVHQETKKRHLIHLAMYVEEGDIESEFTFPNLPLGMYDVTARYGVQIKRQPPETVQLKCHEKAKPCRDGVIRELEVIPPEKEPPVKMTDAGTPEKKDCDFWAE